MSDGVQLHACCGLNQCKGQGKDGSGTQPGDGQCATTEAHNCAGNNNCKGQGGCGYQNDRDRQPSRPGANACRGFGGCGSPIGNQNGATSPNCDWTYQEGPLKGQNVWQAGRQVLAEKIGKPLGPSPCCGDNY